MSSTINTSTNEGIGVRQLMRGLASIPQGIQEPLVVRDRDGRPQEDPLVVHSFCVCSGSTLLGDLLGVSRTMERDLSVLSIYPRIFFCAFCVYCPLLGILFALSYSTICSYVLVSLSVL